MIRSAAVQRINDGLGFRVVGNPLESTIVMRLQEAQRDLEKGKTLPKFLLQEKDVLVLPAGEHVVALPSGFLRDWDEEPLHFTSPSGRREQFLERRMYKDAVQAASHRAGEARSPRTYVILQNTIDFVVKADREYRFLWSWYKAGQKLDFDIENEWLREAPEWLIGEAGYRIAYDMRDKDGMTLFDDLKTKGRASYTADQFVREESGGMFVMGGGL